MTVAELMTSILASGSAAAIGVIVLPLLVGLIALGLQRAGRSEQSQVAANVGIGFGFFTLLVLVCWSLYAATIPGLIGSTNVLVFLAPLYVLVAAFGIEHVLHPTRQESVRARVRKVLLFVIVLGVLYFILSRLDMHMIIWTNMMGFVFFILALIGILYFLVRKVV